MHAILPVAAIVAFVAATPAVAADFAVKASPAIASASARLSWTGCHIGGHAGGVVSQDTTIGLAGNAVNFGSAGFTGGGQIGCDYQFVPGWVAGVEGRAAWTSLKDSRPGVVTFRAAGVTVPSQFTLGNDFLASVTARLGYSVADRWLVFVRGGAAWTRERIDIAFTNLAGIPVDPNETTNRTGWTVGSGMNWAFAPNWSADLEYSYYDFGGQRATLTSAANISVVTVPSQKDKLHTVTAGVDYHF